MDRVLTKAVLFIWKVPAVVEVIAAEGDVNTGPVRTLEPVRLVACPWPKGQKTDLFEVKNSFERKKSQLKNQNKLTTSSFVRCVCALAHPVALKVAGYALPVIAPELVDSAPVQIDGWTVEFVTAVAAVRSAVAQIIVWDTSAVLAGELVVSARIRLCGRDCFSNLRRISARTHRILLRLDHFCSRGSRRNEMTFRCTSLRSWIVCWSILNHNERKVSNGLVHSEAQLDRELPTTEDKVLQVSVIKI
jgi:hypothetical protein